jgi:hypothetical protein
MTKEEKGLLLQLILEDLRGNWGDDPGHRATEAKVIATELGLAKTRERIDQYFEGASEFGDWDGRHFRCDFIKYGGYYGMETIHNLPKTIKDKSDEFKTAALNILTYPEYRFEDWETYQPKE